MKHARTSNLRAPRPRLTALAIACAAASFGGSAGAVELNLGNPDIKARLDTTVRYNLGFRAQDCDTNICGNGTGSPIGGGDLTAHQSDRKFAKAGDVVTNRIDLLPEFDLVYRDQFGARVSAAGWYDAAYSNHVAGDPALNMYPFGMGQGAGPVGAPYLPYTKRYVIGPSGEFLDAFLFAKFDAGSVPVSVKAGQHNIYWGESLFSFVNGISYGQGPVDIRKALATPGIEAKEVFKPLNQLSFNADFTDRISLSGQYLLDWKPSQLPEGGTYFGAADGLSMGGGGSIFGVPFGGVTAEPKDKRGDWGLALKLRPEMADARVGLYYREYSEKFPQLVATGIAVTPSGPVPTGFGLDYSTPRAKMFGVSLGKQVGDVSVGADLTYRENAMLAAKPFATPSGALLAMTGMGSFPTGKVIAGVVNAIAYYGKTPVFDSAALQAELNFSHLSSVTTGANFFKGEGYGGCTDATGTVQLEADKNGCATTNAIGVAVNFEPKWFQVMNGVDLTLPMFVGAGLKGNSAVPFGDNKGQGSYSIGLGADVRNQYSISLKYNGFIARHSNDELGVASTSNASLGKYWDRNWVSLTLKTTF